MTERAHTLPNRCRLVAVLDVSSIGNPEPLAAALMAGDVASLILTCQNPEENLFQERAGPIVKTAQNQGVAAVIADNPRIAARLGADGIQLGQDPDAIDNAIKQYQPKFMVGAANIRSRHTALTIGELQPDYVMFGKPGGDIKPQPHPKNVDLGAWWAAMIEIPCIVLGGSEVQSVVPVAQSGAEFVALGQAVFTPGNDGFVDFEHAFAQIGLANELLDKNAPQFEIDDDA